MKYDFKPAGVCPNKIALEVEDGIVRSILFNGGCNGNLKAIATLVKDMPVDDVIAKLEGIKCGFRPTSCADQLAQALKKIKPGN